MNGGTFKGAPVLRGRPTTRLELPPLVCVQLLFQPAFCSDIKVQITFTRWDVAADETTRCSLRRRPLESQPAVDGTARTVGVNCLKGKR